MEPTGRPVAASGDGIMLTKLSQFQAQGWEKWLFRITFTRGTNSLKTSFLIKIALTMLRNKTL
jgi:hypothetical protein